jgi:hypothetical protein
MASEIYAEMPCTRSDGPWACFGFLEMHVKAGTKNGTIRESRFSNGESMGEIEGQGSRQRFLRVPSTEMTLYSGLSESESGWMSPFAFFGMQFFVPLRSMQIVFPAGVQSVPAGPVERDVVVDEKRFRLSVVRAANDRVTYRVVSLEVANFEFEGTWDGAQVQPLSDDFSLAEWKHTAACQATTMLQARSPDCRRRGSR